MLALMTRLGLRRSMTDHGLLTRLNAGRLVLLVAVHVDDFLFGGTDPWLARFESGLRGSFTAGLTDVGRFSFTGLRVRTAVDDNTGSVTIRVDQDRYIDSIDTISITPTRAQRLDAALTTAELTKYRRGNGRPALGNGADDALPGVRGLSSGPRPPLWRGTRPENGQPGRGGHQGHSATAAYLLFPTWSTAPSSLYRHLQHPSRGAHGQLGRRRLRRAGVFPCWPPGS